MATLKGGDKLEAYLADLSRKVGKGGTLRVGFLEGATYPDGTPVATVAAIQNFGAPAKGIPPRPFFSKMIEDGSGNWGPMVAAALKATGMDVKAALEMVGHPLDGELRQAIVEMNAPALSPVTLLLRDRFQGNPSEITFADVQQARRDVAAGMAPAASGTQAKPLVWSGHMLQSVDHEVEA